MHLPFGPTLHPTLLSYPQTAAFDVNRELPVWNYTVPERISYSSLTPCADSVC